MRSTWERAGPVRESRGGNRGTESCGRKSRIPNLKRTEQFSRALNTFLNIKKIPKFYEFFRKFLRIFSKIFLNFFKELLRIFLEKILKILKIFSNLFFTFCKMISVQSKAPELKQWQAAWCKRFIQQKTSGQICPLRLAVETPLFHLGDRSNSGTFLCTLWISQISKINAKNFHWKSFQEKNDFFFCQFPTGFHSHSTLLIKIFNDVDDQMLQSSIQP